MDALCGGETGNERGGAEHRQTDERSRHRAPVYGSLLLVAYQAGKVAAEGVRNLSGPASVEAGQPSLFGSAAHVQADPAARRRRPRRLRTLEAGLVFLLSAVIPGAQARARRRARVVRLLVLQQEERQEGRYARGVKLGKTFYAKNRREWRARLPAHHQAAPENLAVYYKKYSCKPR